MSKTFYPPQLVARGVIKNCEILHYLQIDKLDKYSLKVRPKAT